MGVELRPTTFKFSEETLHKLDISQKAFSLAVANRTQAARMAIEILHMIATGATLEGIVRGIQGLLRTTLQSEFHFGVTEFPARAAGKGADEPRAVDRPRVVSISRRSAIRCRAAVLPVVEVEAFSSFPGFRPVFEFKVSA